MRSTLSPRPPGFNGDNYQTPLDVQDLKRRVRATAGAHSDLEKAAAESTLNQVTNCYRILLDSFIDNVSKQVIEREIVQRVPEAVSIDWAANLSQSEVTMFAGEKEETVKERKNLETTIERLTYALGEIELHRLKLEGTRA